MVILSNRGPCCTVYRTKHTEIPTSHTTQSVFIVSNGCEADVQSVQAKGSQACKEEEICYFNVNDHLVLNSCAEVLD